MSDSPYLDRCPNCDAEWAYQVNGKMYSRIIGNYDIHRDRTTSSSCPVCRATWDRGDQSIYKPEHRTR